MNGPWFSEAAALGALEKALASSSADHLEISASSRVGEHTRFAGERIHQPQTIVECQILVRAIVGTGSARVGVNRLEQVSRAVGEATELARARNGVPGAAKPFDVAVADREPANLWLWFDETLAWDVGQRSRLAGRVMEEARLAGGVANGTFTTAITELAVVTSRGVRLYAAATEAGFTATLRVGDASSYVGDLGRDASRLNAEERCLEAVGDVAKATTPLAMPDGVHDVVFGPLATGELIGFLPDFGFTAPALRAGTGLVAQRPGEQIAQRSVSVDDDAHISIGLPFPFDFEGSVKRRVPLLSEGRVGGVVSDGASASATGGVSTGHASIGRESSPEPDCANLVMAPGSESEDQLVAGVEHGVYVQRLWYNRLVDAERGLVVGTSRDRCFMIEDGKRTETLAGGRFNESIIDALNRVDGVGTTLVSQPIPNLWNGTISAPAIRVRGFRFGARPRTGEES